MIQTYTEEVKNKKEEITATDKIINFIPLFKIDRTVFIFLMSSIILHWNFFYSLFFITPEDVYRSTGMLKNEWLLKRFFLDSISLFNLPQYVVYVIIYLIAGLFTWLYIYYLQPRVLEKTHRYIIKHKYDLEYIEIEEEKEYTEKKLKSIQAIKVEEKKIKEISILSYVDQVKEYEIFKKDQHLFNLFKETIKVISQQQKLSESILNKLDIDVLYNADLIKVEYFNSDYVQDISFTPKGLTFYLIYKKEPKNFISEYQ